MHEVFCIRAIYRKLVFTRVRKFTKDYMIKIVFLAVKFTVILLKRKQNYSDKENKASLLMRTQNS